MDMWLPKLTTILMCIKIAHYCVIFIYILVNLQYLFWEKNIVLYTVYIAKLLKALWQAHFLRHLFENVAVHSTPLLQVVKFFSILDVDNKQHKSFPFDVKLRFPRDVGFQIIASKICKSNNSTLHMSTCHTWPVLLSTSSKIQTYFERLNALFLS